MDIRKHTTGGNSNSAKQFVELLIVSDGELDVPRDDTRLLVITGGVPGQLEHLGGQVLHDSGHVDGSAGTDAIGVSALLEKPVDTTDRELQTGLGRARRRFLLCFGSHCEAGEWGSVSRF